MKKSLAVLFSIIVLGVATLPASAYSIYMEDKENQYTGPNVDKFQPTTGVKVKPSGLAQMMENATRNATNKNKNYNNTKQQTQPKTQPKNSYSFF